MISQLKKRLYFTVASYFRFFAALRLRKWHPRIVVVTGSNGKTTLLHMLESQLGQKAKYSHHANSSFGVPFNILGLERKTLLKSEWIGLFFLAPFKIFAALPKETFYVVEADCDRPKEGKFLAEFLRPEVTLWVSSSRTHSMNFDRLMEQKKFPTIEEAIAYEFGFFLQYCTKLAIISGDTSVQLQQKDRTNAEVRTVTKNKDLQEYAVTKDGTRFEINGKKYVFPFLLPEEVFCMIRMCKEAVEYLGEPFDSSFAKLSMPPGRGSIFAGIKNTTLIDSSYNANLSSMAAMLTMYKKFPSNNKWAVIADMVELGNEEKEEHEKLAEVLAAADLKKIVLLGPRVSKYTYPRLQTLKQDIVVLQAFLKPTEVLEYITAHAEEGSTILFKGARFLEGVIEHLLKDKKDIVKLPRREQIWEIRRKQWGL